MSNNPELSFSHDTTKPKVFTEIQNYLAGISLSATSVDSERPWGGFFVIDEKQTDIFIAQYFPEFPRDQIERGARLSPKILIVEPGKRLSWQLHHRREELWKNIGETVGYITSPDNTQGDIQHLKHGETVQFKAEIRHRLIGLESWGVVAEIWQHMDPANPSDESDIIRLDDDFGR